MLTTVTTSTVAIRGFGIWKGAMDGDAWLCM